MAKWHIRIYDCLEKEEYENQKVKGKTNRSSSATPTKQNKIKARYKTKPKKKNWTKTQAITTNPKHKTRVSIQEEPLKEDSEEQAVHIIPH